MIKVYKKFLEIIKERRFKIVVITIVGMIFLLGAITYANYKANQQEWNTYSSNLTIETNRDISNIKNQLEAMEVVLKKNPQRDLSIINQARDTGNQLIEAKIKVLESIKFKNDALLNESLDNAEALAYLFAEKYTSASVQLLKENSRVRSTTKSQQVSIPAGYAPQTTPTSTAPRSQKLSTSKVNIVSFALKSELRPLYDQLNEAANQVSQCSSASVVNGRMQLLVGKSASDQQKCQISALHTLQTIENQINSIYAEYGIYNPPANFSYPTFFAPITTIQFDGKTGYITDPSGQINTINCDSNTCYIY